MLCYAMLCTTDHSNRIRAGRRAYDQGYEDAQRDLQRELAAAQQAVERATESQRGLRARLRNREEHCAELERHAHAARGARQHWLS